MTFLLIYDKKSAESSWKMGAKFLLRYFEDTKCVDNVLLKSDFFANSFFVLSFIVKIKIWNLEDS